MEWLGRQNGRSIVSGRSFWGTHVWLMWHTACRLALGAGPPLGLGLITGGVHGQSRTASVALLARNPTERARTRPTASARRLTLNAMRRSSYSGVNESEASPQPSNPIRPSRFPPLSRFRRLARRPRRRSSRCSRRSCLRRRRVPPGRPKSIFPKDGEGTR